MSVQSSQNTAGRCIKATLCEPRTDNFYRLGAFPQSWSFSSFYNIRHVWHLLTEVIKSAMFSRVMDYSDVIIMGSSSNGPFSAWGVGLSMRARTSHTCEAAITSNAHAERRHFQLPPLWSGSARAACVTKSHSQRAFYPPRLRGSWHWQRTCTQRHTHKHHLHAWCNVQSQAQTETFWFLKQHYSVSY